jgi:DNA repair protein RecN (Recombination protein N)
MIINLRIKNVALIDEAEVDFAAGLNVLTGETGAGKSIVVDSISFLLGERTSRDLIRAGADFASVEGILEIPPWVQAGLFSLGIETSDGQIMLARTMQADTGKSTCRINGRAVTVGVLKSAAEMLVDLHGQHEHQSLLDPIKQLEMLDYFCGDELSAQKKILENFLLKYKENNRELKKIEGGVAREQIEIWKFQLNEIESAALKPDEEDALTAKRDRLSGAERLSKNTAGIIGLLFTGYFENRSGLSAVDQTAKAAALSAEIARLDPSREKLHESLVDIHAQLAEITQDFRAYADELDADPHELDRIETRLDLIYRMKKKYGGTVETILIKQNELLQSLENLENSEAEIQKLQTARKEISKEITTLCGKMNEIRTTFAAKISEEITEILRDLGMQDAKFFMEITRKTAFTPDGNDAIEFMISPNPGEPAKPLRKIASGGEMSRIMLAIKP